MVKLGHKTLKSKIAEQNWTQFALAEKLDISDRQIRNLCKKDTDPKLSLCYKNEPGIWHHDGGVTDDPGG